MLSRVATHSGGEPSAERRGLCDRFGRVVPVFPSFLNYPRHREATTLRYCGLVETELVSMRYTRWRSD